MKTILLTAQDFAFGPIGKLLYISENLRNYNYNLVFAGFGTSLQLAKKFNFDQIIEIDTEEEKNKEKLKEIISNSDILISSMDLPSFEIAQKLKKTTVWLDCLFWFWDSIPDSVLNADLYLSERFIDESVNSSKYLPKIKNFVSLGPIMGATKELQRKNKLLISFGGGQATHHYNAGVDTNYPFFMTRLLEKYIDWSNFDDITITTSETIVKKLQSEFKDSIFRFNTFSYDDFLNEMAESQLILTTPGLITAEAAFFSKIPIIFLPASNDSQYLQLQDLRRNGLAPASVSLQDYMPELKIKHIPGKDSTRMMLKQLREFDKSEEIKEKVGEKLNHYIHTCNQWSLSSVEKNTKFLEKLGGNGARVAAEKIVQLTERVNN